MLEEGREEIRTAVCRDQRPGDLGSQVLDILGDEVGQLPICGMPPTLFDDVQLRRLRRQELHVSPCPREIMEQAGGLLVSAAAVPDEEPRAPEMPAEMRDKGKDIIAGDGGGGQRKIQLHTLTHRRDGDGAGH